MCSKQDRMHAVVLSLWCVTCLSAQMQPVASPSVNRDIKIARPAVINQRVNTRVSQSDLGAANNLMITGNVGGNKHFRASVPYTSGSALQATLPSDSLSNFFRLTQAQDVRSSSPLAFTPYYSPTATATRMDVAVGQVVSPVTYGPTATTPIYQPRQFDMGLATGETETVTQSVSLSDSRPATASTDTGSLVDWSFMPKLTDANAFMGLPHQVASLDVVLTQDANGLQQSSPFGTEWDVLSQPMDANGVALTESTEQTGKVAPKDPNSQDRLVASYGITTKMAMQAYAQTQFNTFMKHGDSYLTQGLYDKARDAYALAEVYKPGNALAVVGKCHALLGKRAYSSSALHLIRALAVLPKYAGMDVGLTDMLGGMKATIEHVDRLKACAESKHAPDLKLLLAYVYVQVHDIGMAQKTLDEVIPAESYEPARQALINAAKMSVQ